VLGGNFSLVGVPSVGASGAIFGTSAVAWVDLLAHWKLTYQPGRRVSYVFLMSDRHLNNFTACLSDNRIDYWSGSGLCTIY
jgi:hypothetical protein